MVAAQSHVAPRGSSRAAIKPKGAATKKSSLSDEPNVAVVVKRRPSEATSSHPWALVVSLVVIAIAALLAYTIVPHGFSTSEESSHVKTAESNDDAAGAFVAWFKGEGGFISDAITISHFENMGRGIRAHSVIAENDVMLSVPMDLIICRETIMNSASPELRPKFLKLQATGDELVTAFLLVEQFKNAISHWAPYLRILPAYPKSFENIATPLFFNASTGDLDELQDERMIQVATQERQRAKMAFQRFRRLFKSVLPSKSERSGLSLEKRYLWTRFLVNSRAFSIRGERYLVPFGDIFNGKPQPQRMTATSSGNGAHFLEYHRLQRGVGMEIRADRAIETPGDQVFEDYGDNDNYIYFLYHGFIMESNPFDCAALRLPPLKTTDEAKRRILQEYYQMEGGSESSLVCVTARGSLQNPQDKQVVQLLASLGTMDSVHMEAWCDSRDRATALCLSHATQTEQDQVLLQAIQQRLASYATSIDEDEKILQAPKQLQPGQLHAVRFRLSRKKILISAMERIHQRMDERSQHKATTEMAAQDSDFQHDEAHQQSTATKITRFSQWISTFDFPVNHIELKYASPSMGYGAFATKPLSKGEVYLSVPTEIVMDLHSVARSPFLRDWVIRHRTSTGSRWTESQLLLLHLLHERFAPGHKSFWKPYLDVLPETDRLASPLFFEDKSAELELLREAVPKDLGLLIDDYRRRVDAEYDQLKSTGSLLPDWITLERFRWAHTILDSRSIWWSGTRHLVPLLDMVNCVEISPLHAAHATRLNEESNDAAVTRASWDFAKGDHVVENYAQPNYIYMLYHGFALRENSHDCAHFHFDLLLARQLSAQDADRRVIIAQMERMQLYSWTPDVCVGGQKPIDKLLRVSLIAQSPREAAAEERAHGGEITRKHLDAAEKQTKVRLQTLEKALQHGSEDKPSSQALTFITQQHKLTTQVLKLIQERRHSL